MKADKSISQTTEVYRKPTQYEIRKGYGALHWLTVPASSILNKDGTKRTWILNPYIADKLRYYVPR